MTGHNSNRNTLSILEGPGDDMLPQLTGEGSEQDYRESISELEKDILLAFKKQGNLSSARTPNSLYP